VDLFAVGGNDILARGANRGVSPDYLILRKTTTNSDVIQKFTYKNFT
jgi:hypothetical protein